MLYLHWCISTVNEWGSISSMIELKSLKTLHSQSVSQCEFTSLFQSSKLCSVFFCSAVASRLSCVYAFIIEGFLFYSSGQKRRGSLNASQPPLRRHLTVIQFKYRTLWTFGMTFTKLKHGFTAHAIINILLQLRWMFSLFIFAVAGVEGWWPQICNQDCVLWLMDLSKCTVIRDSTRLQGCPARLSQNYTQSFPSFDHYFFFFFKKLITCNYTWFYVFTHA